MMKSNKKLVPYNMFETLGVDGVVAWYETLGIADEEGALDPRKVHVCPDTYHKICIALGKYYISINEADMALSINMWMMNSGPSGSHKEVPIDQYIVVQK